MSTYSNSLYVQTPGAYLGKKGETVTVKVEDQVKLVVPMHHLEGIDCIGRVSMSPDPMSSLSFWGTVNR